MFSGMISRRLTIFVPKVPSVGWAEDSMLHMYTLMNMGLRKTPNCTSKLLQRFSACGSSGTNASRLHAIQSLILGLENFNRTRTVQVDNNKHS